LQRENIETVGNERGIISEDYYRFYFFQEDRIADYFIAPNSLTEKINSAYKTRRIEKFAPNDISCIWLSDALTNAPVRYRKLETGPLLVWSFPIGSLQLAQFPDTGLNIFF
jgi:hypothetical protein